MATLAAFAALGRIAFAAIPNVKPTTDIVLVSGYALGAGPGFVVGALAALVSNFFFGQGPWTPVADGRLGRDRADRGGARGRDAGAGSAAGRSRSCARWSGSDSRPSRTSATGSPTATTASAQLGVYVGKGIGFDAVHAAGCFVFALAFGPALLRSISAVHDPAAGAVGRAERVGRPDRARARRSAPPAPERLAGQPSQSARRGASPTTYLLSAQNADGGLGGAPGQASIAAVLGLGGARARGGGDQPAASGQGRRTASPATSRRTPADGRRARSSARSSRSAPPGSRRRSTVSRARARHRPRTARSPTRRT